MTYSNVCRADSQEEALKKTGDALYKQYDMETKVNRFINDSVSKKVQDKVGTLGQVYKILSERKVEYTWHF